MSKIADPRKYFSSIQSILNKSAIDMPKNCRDLFELRKGSNGELLGWEVINKRIYFYTEDFLKATEKAIRKKTMDAYVIEQHSYHFNPKGDSGLECFRIDKTKGQGLHANDERNGENHHLSPEQLKIDIHSFNLNIAISLSFQYISTGKYPLDNSFAEEYNLDLVKHRRECNG